MRVKLHTIAQIMEWIAIAAFTNLLFSVGYDAWPILRVLALQLP